MVMLVGVVVVVDDDDDDDNVGVLAVTIATGANVH